MISAGCSTAYFAPLPPYGAYVDVDGKEHTGTDAGEVFKAPPPPPSPYQKGKYNPTGLGEQLLKDGPDGAVVYIGCNTGSQPCALTLLDGFLAALRESERPVVGDCWAERRPLLLRQGGSGESETERRLVSAEHFLPGHEIHVLRRSHAAVPGACGREEMIAAAPVLHQPGSVEGVCGRRGRPFSTRLPAACFGRAPKHTAAFFR